MDERVKEAEEVAEKIASTGWGAIGRKFAFYGTLRRGQGNYTRIIKDSPKAVFEGEAILLGYKMFSFGGFPFVIPTGNQSDTIKVELFDVPEELAARSIHHMELGAGYGVDEVTINDQVYWLYTYSPQRNYKSFPEVPGGDWVEFVKKRTAARNNILD